MMREIKFRGLEVLTGDWVKGSHVKTGVGMHYILPQNLIGNSIPEYHVDKETVGQYTGLKDKNGKDIYEGDILQFSGSVVALGVVKYNESLCCFQACHNMSCWLICKESGVEAEVIGNIYENPYLVNTR